MLVPWAVVVVWNLVEEASAADYVAEEVFVEEDDLDLFAETVAGLSG